MFQVVDMIAQVTIYQEYENSGDEAIEAKYVFPLTDTACVCGFEAFINEKRLVGVCKEKQEARKEYREAIEQGKGAYLMDQETVEVFTVNVGNLPKKSRCIIKITYVTELDVQNESIVFRLPNSVASWQAIDVQRSGLQSSVLTKLVNELDACNKHNSVVTKSVSSFRASVCRPFEIQCIESPTHTLRLKQTRTQAVLEVDTDVKAG